jgi:hypothetical protein
MFNEWVAVMLSVTFVLAFGEVYLFVNVLCLEVRHQPLTYLRDLLQEWFDRVLKSLNMSEDALEISLCIAFLLCFCWHTSLAHLLGCRLIMVGGL